MSEPVCFAVDPQLYVFVVGFLCGLIAAGLVASFVMLKRAGRTTIALALLLAAPLAAQPMLPHRSLIPPVEAQATTDTKGGGATARGVRSREANDGGGSDDAAAPVPAPAPPATLADWTRTHLAAVAYCPVRTKREEPTPPPETGAAQQPAKSEPGCAVGAAIRVTPDRWLPWAAGPFIGEKDVGPWVGYVLYRGKGGSAGLGIGYRLPMNDGIELRDGKAVIGITLSLAAARGGG